MIESVTVVTGPKAVKAIEEASKAIQARKKAARDAGAKSTEGFTYKDGKPVSII